MLGKFSPTKAADDRDTFPIMGLAALMIVNSHLEGVYPQAWMAADGLLGNLAFYSLSGYGTWMSQVRHPYGLGRFLQRRARRIYPPLWCSVAIAWSTGVTPLVTDGYTTLKTLVWPTDYGFISHIIVFYPIGWLMSRWPQKSQEITTFGIGTLWVTSLVYAAATIDNASGHASLGSLPGYQWSVFFLFAFILGGQAGMREVTLGGRIGRPDHCKRSILIASLLITYALVKFIYYKANYPVTYAPIIAFIVLTLALVAALSAINKRRDFNAVLASLKLKEMAGWIGKSSLEIYLAHWSVIYIISQTRMSWQWKIMAIHTGSIFSGYLLRIVIGRIFKLIPLRSSHESSS